MFADAESGFDVFWLQGYGEGDDECVDVFAEEEVEICSRLQIICKDVDFAAGGGGMGGG